MSGIIHMEDKEKMTPKGIVFATNKHTNVASLKILDNYADARVWADKFFFDSCGFEVSVHEVDIDDDPTEEEWDALRRYTQTILDILNKARKWEHFTRVGAPTKPPIGKPNKITDYEFGTEHLEMSDG